MKHTIREAIRGLRRGQRNVEVVCRHWQRECCALRKFADVCCLRLVGRAQHLKKISRDEELEQNLRLQLELWDLRRRLRVARLVLKVLTHDYQRVRDAHKAIPKKD